MSNAIDPEVFELPPRKWTRDQHTAAALARKSGADEAAVAASARMQSHFEWDEDMDWLECQRNTHGLSLRNVEVIKARLRQRNVKSWGPYSHTPD